MAKVVLTEEIAKKMISEAIAAQNADIGVIREKRGTEFKVTDCEPYVEAVKGMTVGDGQAKSVIDLHVQSVVTHYETLKGLTSVVRPEDDPFVEHYQTPAILEILYEEDPTFRTSMEKFIDAIGKHEALIGKESMMRYGGAYGPTCVVDFALIPGSTSNVVNRILKTLDIDKDHKKTILASKSWGMDTSYGIGAAFQASINAGKTLAEAVKDEITTFKMVYDTPTEAQAKLMEDAGHTSFAVTEYMKQYKEKMKPFIKAAMDDGVHYGNIVVVPAYCVGDVAHHIAQSMFNMCKDDMTFAILESVSQVLEKSLTKPGVEKVFKKPFQVLNAATTITAIASAYILELDGFTGHMVIDLLTKRFSNYVLQYPDRGPAAELHNVDFMDMILEGWEKLFDTRRHLDGKEGPIKPVAYGVEIDLSPIDEHDVIQNPQRYTYPACAITVRFSSLMRLADFPCLLTSEPVTATLMTNIIALDKESVTAPARVCKNCAANRFINKVKYCQWAEAI
jgi:hypothetical protein